MRLLTFMTIIIMVAVWINYHWNDYQKIETCNKSYSLSKTNTPVVEMKIDILNTTIKNNRENLRNQLSKIESQMTQLQFNIQNLMDNQNKKISTAKSNDRHKIKNIPVSILTIESNENKPAIKTEEREELMDSMVEDNELIMHDREELLQSMAQDNESDPEWSIEASQSIYEAFSTDEIDSIYLENVECGATLCQANLYLDGTADFDDSYSEILNRIPWPSQGFAQIDEESGRIEFYLAREGHELPNLEDETTIDEH